MPDIFVANQAKTDSTPAQPVVNQVASQTTNQGEGKIRLFTAFCKDPVGLRFNTQDPTEAVLLFLRKHFITNVPWIIKAIIASLVPIVIKILGQILGSSIIPFSLPLNFILLSTAFFYLLIFTYIFVNFITWFFNISLVTSHRVIDISFSQLILESVSATKLAQVEDVKYVQVGFIRSVFDYGDVFVQTAGTNPNFESLAVPHPQQAVDIIENLIEGDHGNA